MLQPLLPHATGITASRYSHHCFMLQPSLTQATALTPLCYSPNSLMLQPSLSHATTITASCCSHHCLMLQPSWHQDTAPIASCCSQHCLMLQPSLSYHVADPLCPALPHASGTAASENINRHPPPPPPLPPCPPAVTFPSAYLMLQPPCPPVTFSVQCLPAWKQGVFAVEESMARLPDVADLRKPQLPSGFQLNDTQPGVAVQAGARSNMQVLGRCVMLSPGWSMLGVVV